MAGSDDYPRSHRVADFIQRELSGMIRTEVRDPRLSPFMTIASVEVSRDLSVAKIYWSVLDAEEKAETAAALKRASGFLRRRLAQEMKIRSVPELRFHHDDSIAHGARMSALIADAVATNTTAADGDEGEGGVDGQGGSADSDPVDGGPADGGADGRPSEDLSAEGHSADGHSADGRSA